MRFNAILISIIAVACATKDEEERVLSPYLDADQDGFPETEDCNDKDPGIHPDALEMCDGIDNNCDGVEDEDSAYDAPLWFEDKDGDTFGDPNSTAPGCEPPLGYVGVQTDCDDVDSSAYPGAVEMCDTVDNDCDGTIDEGTAYDAVTWFRDQDGDRYGSFFDQIRSCIQPEGYVCVLEPSDDPCSDSCDNDLDGLTDQDDPDCDGFDAAAINDDGVLVWSTYNTAEWENSEVRFWDYNRDTVMDFDCNDNDEGFSPGAKEQCDINDMDENCDGLIDDETLELAAAVCDPAAEEEDFLACLEDTLAVGMVQWNEDVDHDSYGNPDAALQACDQPDGMVGNELDCDDGQALVNPDNAEVCGDSIDNDCDGETDEEDAPYPLRWYQDDDGDGYGNADLEWPVEQCTQPVGYVADATDCDDGDSSINPGVTETWYDGTDDDCDGNDNDEDGDGYVGEGDGGDDCEDGDPLSNPGAPEICGDDTDNNCDGVDEECEAVDAIVGLAAYDRTGASLSMGGDVDNDGNSDILIGASVHDGSGLSRGAAYLLLGDVTGEVAAGDGEASLFGEADHDRAGSSVAIVGDTNGDGYADLVIGAFAEDAGGGEAGAAYLVLGPVSGDIELGDADAKLIGEVGEDHAGMVVAAAGDTNDDGNMDFYVGAPGYDSGALSEVGASYLIHGPLDDDADLSFAYIRYIGAGNGEESGSSLASAGDFNGDGFDDALIGAPNGTEGGVYTGAVYLVLNDDGPGGSMGLDEADARWHGINGGDQAGYSIASAGDQNGDGLSDIIIGAPGNDSGGAGSGAAFIVYGGTSMLCDDGELCDSLPLAAADAILIGERGDDYSGGAVSGGSDIDGDGVPDVAIGSRTEDSTDSDAGSASVMFGPLAGSIDMSESMAKVVGLNAGDWTGAAVAMGGDINGDGFGDLLVGAPQLDVGEDFVDIGAVLIMKGGWMAR